VCHPQDLLTEASRSGLIIIRTGSEVVDVTRTGDGFEVEVRWVEGQEKVRAGAVIIATGALPYDPLVDARLHHGECSDVLSALEVERMLATTNGLVVPSTGKAPREMAMVQCVGSRDVARGMPYCSKACCKYAHRIGERLRHLIPELRISVFYMDWRPLGEPPGALDQWAARDGLVRLVRSRPAEVIVGSRPSLRYASPDDKVEVESFDIVMLSVGLMPDPENVRLVGLFGLKIDELGLLSSPLDDVVVAGTCGGPKDIRESVEEGTAAAGRVAGRLEAVR
jgi:heterodisulfide reductase subunit A